MPGSGFGMMRCWTAQNVAPAPMPRIARMLVTAMAAMAPSESPSEGVSGLEAVVVAGAGLSGAACAGAATPSVSEQARAAAIVVFLICKTCHKHWKILNCCAAMACSVRLALLTSAKGEADPLVFEILGPAESEGA